MDYTKLYFLRLLSDFINKRKSYAPHNEVDWLEISILAKLHNVSAIIYYQCKNFSPNAAQLQTSYASQLYYSINRKDSINVLNRSLESVPHVLVKGAEISNIYPIPELRSMGDVDVLIQKKDRQFAHECLIKNGFNFIKTWNGEWTYSRSGLLFEIHDELVYDTSGKKSIVQYFAKVWKYLDGEKLNCNFHFIYIIEHMREHFVSQGIGFRMFMDVAIMTMYMNLDWEWIAKELNEIKLLEFTQVVLTLNQKWFEVISPLDIQNITKEMMEEFTDKVFKDGTFGYGNKENKNNELAKMIHYQSKKYFTIKIKYIFEEAFPSYQRMKELPYCTFLNRYNYLLPIAWVYRFFYRIGNKKHREGLKKRVFASRDDVDNRIEILHKWGL